MYQNTDAAAVAASIDPNATAEGPPVNGAGDNHGFSHQINSPFAPPSLIMIEAATQQLQPSNSRGGGEEAPIEIVAQQLQCHLDFTNVEQIYQNSNENHLAGLEGNWVANATTNFSHNPYHHAQQEQPLDLHQNFNVSGAAGPTNDFLNLLHLPRCASSLLPNPSISFTDPTQKPGADLPSSFSFLGVEIPITTTDNISDPLFHLNMPPAQPPLFRDLMFQSFSGGHGCGLPRNASSLFGGAIGMDEGEWSGGVCQDYPIGDSNGVFEFSRDDMASCLGNGKESKCPKNFVTERQRRVNMNDKYKHLRSLVPNPTKNDRASIVGDAVDYIKELSRRVNELKFLVEKKRCAKARTKRHKGDNDGGPGGGTGGGDVETTGPNIVKTEEMDPSSFNGSLRSSWLQRKCKDTEVDVRIIDDEVTIKLVQRKKINCLLYVSRALDELQLDLRHAAGGHVGDYYSFLFSTKTYEGSSVYASAIANRLIGAVDRQYAAINFTS